MKNSVCQFIYRFVCEDEAATAVEYSVMLALIIVTCLVTVQAVGNNASDLWNDIATELDGARVN